MISATKDNKFEAESWLSDTKASGATDLKSAIDAAIDLAETTDNSRIPVILFITDGGPHVGENNFQTMISAIAAIGNFIINHRTTPASENFKQLIHKISGNLQLSSDILERIQIDKNIDAEKNEDAHDKLFDTYKKLSNLRDENIKKGNQELDTETLHQLQEAYLISNHLNWLKTLSESLKKAIEKYASIHFE